MKILKLLLSLFFVFSLTACTNKQVKPFNNKLQNNNVLTGFNINWSFLPKLNKDIIKNIVLLKPQIIRYPGGTVSKTWNWEQGISSKKGKRISHQLSDLIKLKKATNADVIFVLNTISSTLKNQLLLLKTAQNRGITIKYIEIGNEHYLGKGKNPDDSGKHQDNVKAFPTGKEYALLVNRYATALRKEFPDVKIGITMLSRTNVKDRRQKQWNSLVLKYVRNKNYDALIYHIYLKTHPKIKLTQTNIDKIIKKRTIDFEKTLPNPVKKEIWITEYGVHASTEQRTAIITNALANYVESVANISMAHVIYGSNYAFKTNSTWKYFSMLTKPNGKKFTKLGQVFKKRVH